MKKLGTIAIALLVALGALGLGFAWWTSSLSIGGTVNTGTVNVDMVGASAVDNEIAPVDVGTAGAAVVDTKTGSITVGNAYPGYVATGTLTVKNSGTIPVKLDSLPVTGGDAAVYDVATSGIAAGDELAVNESRDVVVTITVKDDAPAASMGGSTTFTVAPNFIQWNAH